MKNALIALVFIAVLSTCAYAADSYCPVNPVSTYMDILLGADPAKPTATVFIYELSERYIKTPVRNGLVYRLNITDPAKLGSGTAENPMLCYDATTNDADELKAGRITFEYPAGVEGCMRFQYIFCPLVPNVTDTPEQKTEKAMMCLEGVVPETFKTQLITDKIPRCPTATGPAPIQQADYLLSYNDLSLCNSAPKNWAGLCWPLMLIFGLLLGASFALGRNPFAMFDFSSMRMSRGKQYTMRQQNKSFDLTNIAMGATQAAGTAGKARDALSTKSVQLTDAKTGQTKTMSRSEFKAQYSKEQRKTMDVKYGFTKSKTGEFRGASNWDPMGSAASGIGKGINKLTSKTFIGKWTAASAKKQELKQAATDKFQTEKSGKVGQLTGIHKVLGSMGIGIGRHGMKENAKTEAIASTPLQYTGKGGAVVTSSATSWKDAKKFAGTAGKEEYGRNKEGLQQSRQAVKGFREYSKLEKEHEKGKIGDDKYNQKKRDLEKKLGVAEGGLDLMFSGKTMKDMKSARKAAAAKLAISGKEDRKKYQDERGGLDTTKETNEKVKELVMEIKRKKDELENQQLRAPSVSFLGGVLSPKGANIKQLKEDIAKLEGEVNKIRMPTMSWGERYEFVRQLRKLDKADGTPLIDGKTANLLRVAINKGNAEGFNKILHEKGLDDMDYKFSGKKGDVSVGDIAQKAKDNVTSDKNFQRNIAAGSFSALFTAPNVLSILLIWKIKPWQVDEKDLGRTAWQQVKDNFRVDFTSVQEAIKTILRLLKAANELLAYTQGLGMFGKALKAGGATKTGTVVEQAGSLNQVWGFKQLDQFNHIEVGNVLGTGHTYTVGELGSLLNRNATYSINNSMMPIVNMFINPLIDAASETAKVKLSKKQEDTGVAKEFDISGVKYRVMTDSGLVYGQDGKIIDLNKNETLKTTLQAAWNGDEHYSSRTLYCAISSSGEGITRELGRREFGQLMARQKDWLTSQMIIEQRRLMLLQKYAINIEGAKELASLKLTGKDVEAIDEFISDIGRKKRLGEEVLSDKENKELAELLVKAGIINEGMDAKGKPIDTAKEADKLIDSIGIGGVIERLDRKKALYNSAANSDGLFATYVATTISLENRNRQLAALEQMRMNTGDFSAVSTAMGSYKLYEYISNEANNLTFMATMTSKNAVSNFETLIAKEEDQQVKRLYEWQKKLYEKMDVGNSAGMLTVLNYSLGNLTMLNSAAKLHSVAGEGAAQEQNLNLIKEKYKENIENLNSVVSGAKDLGSIMLEMPKKIIANMNNIQNITQKFELACNVAANRDVLMNAMRLGSKILDEKGKENANTLIEGMTNLQIEKLNAYITSGSNVDAKAFETVNKEAMKQIMPLAQTGMAESNDIRASKMVATQIMAIIYGKDAIKENWGAMNGKIRKQLERDYTAFDYKNFEFDINDMKLDIAVKEGGKLKTIKMTVGEALASNDEKILNGAAIASNVDYLDSLKQRMTTHDCTGSMHKFTALNAAKEIDKEKEMVMEDYKNAVERITDEKQLNEKLDKIYDNLSGMTASYEMLETRAYNTSDLMVDKQMYGKGAGTEWGTKPTYLGDTGLDKLNAITKKDMPFAHVVGLEVPAHALFGIVGVGVGYGGINDDVLSYSKYARTTTIEPMEKAPIAPIQIDTRMPFSMNMERAYTQNLESPAIRDLANGLVEKVMSYKTASDGPVVVSISVPVENYSKVEFNEKLEGKIIEEANRTLAKYGIGGVTVVAAENPVMKFDYVGDHPQDCDVSGLVSQFKSGNVRTSEGKNIMDILKNEGFDIRKIISAKTQEEFASAMQQASEMYSGAIYFSKASDPSVKGLYDPLRTVSIGTAGMFDSNGKLKPRYRER